MARQLIQLGTAPTGAGGDTARQAFTRVNEMTAELYATQGTQAAKLAGIAEGATANAADSFLLDRANHTGTQAASTISDFDSATRAQVETELIAGTNVTITPAGSGATRTLTIAAPAGGATLPVVQALSSTRNLGLADINTFNVNSTGTDYTVTIQPQSAETWTADAEIHFLPSSTGDIVITGGAGVSLNGVVAGSITLSTQYGAASIKRIAADSWWVGGVIGTLASYTNLTLLAPFTWDAAGDAADYHQPSYTKVDNVVRLRGKVTVSGTHTDGSTWALRNIAVLPVGFRPAKRKAFIIFWDTDTPLYFSYCLMFVNTDGGIFMLGAREQSYPFTDGHFPLDQIWFDLAP